MQEFLFQTKIFYPFEQVKEHFNQKLFERLLPKKSTILRYDGHYPGAEIHLVFNLFYKRLHWESLITQVQQNHHSYFFVDEGKHLPWPLKSWSHEHRIFSLNQHSIIEDKVQYSSSFPIKYILYSLFKEREKVYKDYFTSLFHHDNKK